MKISNESKNLIHQLVADVIARYTGLEAPVLTDIHFQPSFLTGELRVYDDDDQLLAQTVITELEGLRGEEGQREVSHLLRRALDCQKQAIDSLSILKPFSFVLVDEDRETLKDLLLIDEELLIADEGLLEGLDEELEQFLKDLLED